MSEEHTAASVVGGMRLLVIISEEFLFFVVVLASGFNFFLVPELFLNIIIGNFRGKRMVCSDSYGYFVRVGVFVCEILNFVRLLLGHLGRYSSTNEDVGGACVPAIVGGSISRLC